ncbi:aBC transporter related protein [Clostridium sp. CAG:921]|nr:aBC transporter related protein [Clostridium sp. CAG:921]
MKELLNVVSKKLFFISIIVNIMYSLADYVEPFILSYFGVSPLLPSIAIKLTIFLAIAEVIKLITGKMGSYIDNINETKTRSAIERYYFKKLQTMTMDQISNIHTGYICKLINSVSKYFFEMIWQFQISVIPLVVGSISILGMIFRESIITGIICIVISFLAVFLKYKMIKNMQKYQKNVNEAASNYNAKFIDFIQNIITIRKLNISKFCEEKIIQNSNEYLEATKLNEKKRSFANGTFTMLLDLLYLVIFIIAIIMILEGKDTLPYILFFVSVLGKLYKNLNSLVKLIDITEKFKTSKKQLDECFNDSIETNLISDFDYIKLSNVIFSYTKNSGKIKIPEFRIKKGDKISIVGESGQGKTTVMNILAGLYKLENGELIIDGSNSNKSRLDLVFVSQEVELFDLSIRENLCLGKNVSDEKLLKLLDEAGLMSWYGELKDGLDTIVGEKGVKLSAGQRQRLNLIRGILMDKSLYLLDEPTSNLDNLSEKRILNMIEKYLKDKTYVIVTHRQNLESLCSRHYMFSNHIITELKL